MISWRNDHVDIRRREDDVRNQCFCLFIRPADVMFSLVRRRLLNGNLDLLLFVCSVTLEVLEEYQLAYDKFGRYGGSAVQDFGGWQQFSP